MSRVYRLCESAASKRSDQHQDAMIAVPFDEFMQLLLACQNGAQIVPKATSEPCNRLQAQFRKPGVPVRHEAITPVSRTSSFSAGRLGLQVAKRTKETDSERFSSV